MVATLSLVYRTDTGADVNTLSLLSFTAGIDLEYKGWIPKVTRGDGKPVNEVMSLLLRGSTTNALAGVMQLVDEKIAQMMNYKDKVNLQSVWLRTSLDGETTARQSLIVDMYYEQDSDSYRGASADGYYYQVISLRVSRNPHWEALATTVYNPTASVNAVGGTVDYTTYGGSPGAVVGDAPARIVDTLFWGDTLADNIGLYKFWMGFRTNRFGDRSHFQTYWSLRKAVTKSADTTAGTTNPDVECKDGYSAITDFTVSASLTRRLTVRVYDVAPSYVADQRGHFTVLLRARLSAAGVVRARMASGLYNPRTTLMTGSVLGRVPITGTSWNFYKLGAVQIPAPGRVTPDIDFITFSSIGIDAERVSGSCALVMDCLVLIPDNEGFLYADGGFVCYESTYHNPLHVTVSPDGTQQSIGTYHLDPLSVGLASVKLGLPTGNGIAVLAAQRETVSVLADTCQINMQIFKRWNTLRGAE